MIAPAEASFGRGFFSLFSINFSIEAGKMVKRKWKLTIVFLLLWIMLPVLLILAIQENGTLVFQKKDSLEESLPFIVAAYAEDDFHMETMKAMAVILRSNYTNMLEKGNITFSEIKETYVYIRKTDYIENQSKYEWAYEACQETKGEILTYEGDACYCPFFYLSSGMTRDAFSFFEESRYPYLIAVPSHKDEECDTYFSYYYFSIEDFEDENEMESEAFGEKNMDDTEEKNEDLILEEGREILQILEYDDAGYVTWIRVGEEIMGGEVFRKKYGLSSGCFSIEQENTQIRIICKGLGHGFGFSQYGANVMAQEGKDYQALLKHYFPNLVLENRV